MKTLAEKLNEAKIVAVLAVNDARDAVDLAKALIDGGVRAIEMTLRTENAFDCISAIAEMKTDLMLGVGTVLTPDQAREAKKRGAVYKEVIITNYDPRPLMDVQMDLFDQTTKKKWELIPLNIPKHIKKTL